MIILPKEFNISQTSKYCIKYSYSLPFSAQGTCSVLNLVIFGKNVHLPSYFKNIKKYVEKIFYGGGGGENFVQCTGQRAV